MLTLQRLAVPSCLALLIIVAAPAPLLAAAGPSEGSPESAETGQWNANFEATDVCPPKPVSIMDRCVVFLWHSVGAFSCRNAGCDFSWSCGWGARSGYPVLWQASADCTDSDGDAFSQDCAGTDNLLNPLNRDCGATTLGSSTLFVPWATCDGSTVATARVNDNGPGDVGGSESVQQQFSLCVEADGEPKILSFRIQ